MTLNRPFNPQIQFSFYRLVQPWHFCPVLGHDPAVDQLGEIPFQKTPEMTLLQISEVVPGQNLEITMHRLLAF